MKVAMLAVGSYYTRIVIPASVSAQGIIDLMSSQVYSKEYGGLFKLCDDVVDIEFVDANLIPTPDKQAVIDMHEVLAENNRLAREVESLKAMLETAKQSSSKIDFDILTSLR